jgi:hypothetical protein
MMKAFPVVLSGVVAILCNIEQSIFVDLSNDRRMRRILKLHS